MERILKVYRLKHNHWEFKRFTNCFEKVQFIIDRHRGLNEDLESVGLSVPHLYYKGLHFHLYNFSAPAGESQWKAFFPKYFSATESFRIQTFSFVLFAHDKENIFSLIGGRGNFAVKRYVDVNFGLDITTRVIRPVLDTVHFAELRGITGNIAGRSEAYREDQKIIDIDSFGKIFKQILFEIDESVLADKFNIDLSRTRRKTIFAEAATAFTLKIGVDFDGFCQLIHDFLKVLGMPETISLSTFAPIVDAEQVEKSINIQLFKTIQQRLQTDEVRKGELFFFDYDFCHPDKMLDFYECDFYQVFGKRDRDPLWETENKNEIIEYVLDYAKENVEVNSLREVMSFLGGIQVRGIKNNSSLTVAPLMSHISCEIYYRGRNVYKIDDQWFSVRGDFVSQLDQQCRNVFVNHKCLDILPEIWMNPDIKDYSEDWYNKRYLDYDRFIVLDKILGQNIELCDLLFATDDTLYLIHVKKGFNGMMRDLTNQVRIAARRLWIDIKTEDKSFLNEIYNKLVNHNNFKYCWQPTAEEFVRLFVLSKVVFVIAFCSTNKTGRRVFQEVETFQSNIAKYSLTETVREMKDQEYGIEILEIEHQFE